MREGDKSVMCVCVCVCGCVCKGLSKVGERENIYMTEIYLSFQ